MTQYEMTEQLSRKCNVTLEEAKSALEQGDWNMLTATHLMEQAQFRRMQEMAEMTAGGAATAVQAAPEAEEQAEVNEAEAIEIVTVEQAGTAGQSEAKKRNRGQGRKRLGGHIRRLAAFGTRNRLIVRKGDEKLIELPVIALAVLLLCAFWVCVPLLVIGLFAGCRYSFGGRELGREGINSALDRAADAADHMRQSVAKA